MTKPKPNDKPRSEYFAIIYEGPREEDGDTIAGELHFQPLSGVEYTRVVAMADVQPLVEAVGEFLKLNEAIRADPHNVGDEWENSIERLEAALEKWNGK